jgi:hypothetical protein
MGKGAGGVVTGGAAVEAAAVGGAAVGETTVAVGGGGEAASGSEEAGGGEAVAAGVPDDDGGAFGLAPGTLEHAAVSAESITVNGFGRRVMRIDLVKCNTTLGGHGALSISGSPDHAIDRTCRRAADERSRSASAHPTCASCERTFNGPFRW